MPLLNLFKPSQKGSALLKKPCSQQQAFEREGWIVVDISIPDFDVLSASIIKSLEPKYGNQKRILDAWKWCAPVRRLAREESILKIVESLYKKKPFPFQTLNFPTGTGQFAHSDTIHFHTDPPGQMAGVWIALEDTDEHNGPLFVCPGSHKLPVYSMQDFGLRPNYEDYPQYEAALAEVIKENNLERKPVYLRKGQAVIWSANLLHGGMPIKDKARSRHSQATHYFLNGCKKYYTPMLSDLKRGIIYERKWPGF